MTIEVKPFEDRWKARSVAQQAALRCPADILLFGGAAGSLKSETMLMDALKFYDRPKYRAVIFRRTFPEIQFLIERTETLYSGLGGKLNHANRTWRWPWGSTIEFRYLDKDTDIYKHQGPEYQFAGFDESTHFLEKQVRYIISSRMRSTEGIPQRVRLATNPGNRGHSWHMNTFIGPKCPHCLHRDGLPRAKWPKKMRDPYTLYTDATYEDGRPIGQSTMFIPGLVVDHNLFGKDGGEYARKLRGLSKAMVEALLAGCWEAFEGMYFDVFSHEDHVRPHEELLKLVKPYWPKWTSTDWGFQHLMVSHLWTRSPEGKIYTIGEHAAAHREGTDYANDIKMMWEDWQPKTWFLSPDAFKHDGKTDFSMAEMMSQATGLGFEPAYNDRVSGAQLMYQLLQDYRWEISDVCEGLVKAVSTRIHDEEKKDEDVKKDSTDEDDYYDSARYGVASWFRPGKKPEHEEVVENIDKMVAEGRLDPTSAMMKYQFELNKLRQGSMPTFYRHRK